MRLKILLQHKNNLIYIALALTISILIINSYSYLVLVIPYIYYLYKAKRKYIKYILFTLIIFAISYTVQYDRQLKQKIEYQVTVIGEIEQSEYTSFKGKIDNNIVKVYLSDNVTLIPGDILLIIGEVNIPDKATTPYGFNYRNYLKSKKIYNTIFVKDYHIINHKFIIEIIPFLIEKYIDSNINYSNEYVKTFILANKKGFDQETINQINSLGISHLFAVSGMHIGILVLALKKLFDYIKINSNKSDIYISLFLLTYIVITSFAPSVVRASLMFVFLILNKKYNFSFSTIDILSIIYILLLLINPYYMYSLGFILSFFVTFIILLSKNILNDKSKNIQLLYLSLIAFSFTLPLIMKINHGVNILSIFLNILFVYIITFIILPFAYIVFIFPIFDYAYGQIINLFEMLLEKLYAIDNFVFFLNFNNKILLISYYILLVLFIINIENKKKNNIQIIFLVIVVFLSLNTAKMNIISSVSFIDIYGDSTLIVDSFDQCNILIDTGEVDDYNVVINYLKNKGIKTIDFLIITHMHSDHYGEANDIFESFTIKNFISNNSTNIFIDHDVKCGNISFYIYPLQEYDKNENNNSLIISLFINNEHYLFTGDMEKKAELEFVKKYNFDIDILKVAHHGSSTSSTDDFISIFKPEYAVIIAHRYNKFNHPNQSTLNTLNKYNITTYITKEDGTVEFKYIFNKRYIKTYPPR